MAGADATAELEVLVQIRDAVSNLKTVSQEAKTQSDAMSKSFDMIKVAAAAAVAVFASKQVLDFFASGIEAAVAQQDAMRGLATQLQLTGDYSAKAMDHFADFADEMERTTNIGDDLIIQQVGIAKSFGVSNEQAEKMVKAAVELSAATGKELEPTLRTLGKSLSGTLGPLDDQIGAMKGLTKAQLEAGEQFDLLIDRYGGTAVGKIQTFSGAIDGTKNAFGNFQEAFGKVIVENPALMTAIQEIGNLFNTLTDVVGENEDALSDLVTGGINVVTATIGASLDLFVLFVGGIKAIKDTADDAQVALLAMASLIPGFEDDATAIASKVIDAKEANDSWLDSIGERGAEASLKFQEISEKIAGAAKVEQAAADSTVSASHARRDAYKDEAAAADDLAKRAKLMGPFVSGDQRTAADARQADMAKMRQSKFMGPGASPDQRREADAFQADLSAQQASDEAARQAVFSNIGSVVGSGDGRASAEAAGKLLGTAVADAFVPGLGQAVGPILGVLMQGPEATEAFIKDFISAIPDIVTAIAESAPVVVEALVESLINDGGAIRIAVALTKAMAGEAVWKAIGEQIGLEFGESFQAQNIGGTIREAFGQGAERLREFPVAFNESITRFQDAGHNAGTAITDALKQAPGHIKAGFFDSIPVIKMGVSQGLSSVQSSITDAINEAADSLGIPRPAWLDDLINAFNPGGSGGGGGFIGQVSRGEVGFSLSGGDSGGGSVMTNGDAILAILGRQLEVLRAIEAGGRLSSKSHADGLSAAILRLNRRGARLNP